MGAAKFIGRVGALAVATGVGSAWLAVGVAFAETGPESAASPDSQAQTSQARAPQSTRQAPTGRGSAASARANRAVDTSADTAPAADPIVDVAGPSGRGSADSIQIDIPDQAGPKASAAVSVQVDNQAAPKASATVDNQNANPVAPQASAQSSAKAGGSLTLNPSVTWGGEYDGKAYPGLLVGTVGATSPYDLKYSTVSEPSGGGKLATRSDDVFLQGTRFSKAGEFFYLPDMNALYTPNQVETFKIRVSERTPFDQTLAGIPIIGLITPTIIDLLQQIPLISTVLAPLIGVSEVAKFEVSPYQKALSTTSQTVRPTAFTTKVESFDGLMVSTNYFPATNVATGAVTSAPTIVFGPGLGTKGVTNPVEPNGQLGATNLGSLTPGLPVLRDGQWISTDGGPSYTAATGFNVVTWDPRGSFQTKNRKLPGLQIDSPFFEARDTSALISWLVSPENRAQSQAALGGNPANNDPLIGMVGGSYGGGIPWTTSAIDPRVDAIAPEISWNSLISALYPNTNQFRTGWGSILGGLLVASGTDSNSQIYTGVLTGALLGWLGQTSQAVLASAGPTVLVDRVTSPALIFQGVQDGLFPLSQSVANAKQLVAAGTETKMVWFCGGHGQCNVPLNAQQDDRGFVDNLKWFDRYLVGVDGSSTDIKKFQWYDQLGDYYSSDLLPFQAGFNKPTPLTVTGTGGTLGLWPIFGGSGPGGVEGVFPLLTFPNAALASNAINVTVTPPSGSQIVGAPTLSFSYSGLGSSRTVYAQLVDDKTNKVLGNIVTPIPVKLDGRDHTVEIPMEDIAYTTPAGGTLKLQITSSATNFENFINVGVINISDVKLDVPIRA